MRLNSFRKIWMLFFVIMLASCGTSDMIRPSQKIGPMWVNRYGHTTAENIWDHCDGSMTETPGTQTTDCTVPLVDELFIGHGLYGVDEAQRDALWNAATWELFIDGHAVDLPAFNIADFEATQDGETYQYRVWRIRLREIPDGLHTLRYVMHVNQEVDGVFDAQSIGAYELVVNFTFGK